MRKLAFLVSFILILGCTKKSLPDSHNSMNSLDWAGVYSGELVLKGEKVASALVLNYDLTYSLFLENDKTSGVFKWKNDGQTVVLSGVKPKYFFVGENFVKSVDQKGRLEMNESITEKYWKLTELNGKPVLKTEREAHLIFKTDDATVKGFTGCNTLRAAYSLDESELKLEIENGMTSLKACNTENNETEFRNVLQLVDNYSFNGSVLKFYQRNNNQAIAKFEVVYLK